MTPKEYYKLFIDLFESRLLACEKAGLPGKVGFEKSITSCKNVAMNMVKATPREERNIEVGGLMFVDEINRRLKTIKREKEGLPYWDII